MGDLDFDGGARGEAWGRVQAESYCIELYPMQNVGVPWAC